MMNVCIIRLNGIVVNHLKKQVCIDLMRKTLNKRYVCTLEVKIFARTYRVRNGMWDSVIQTQLLLGADIYIWRDALHGCLCRWTFILEIVTITLLAKYSCTWLLSSWCFLHIEVIITFVETVVLRGYHVIKMFNFEEIISMVLARGPCKQLSCM